MEICDQRQLSVKINVFPSIWRLSGSTFDHTNFQDIRYAARIRSTIVKSTMTKNSEVDASSVYY